MRNVIYFYIYYRSVNINTFIIFSPFIAKSYTQSLVKIEMLGTENTKIKYHITYTSNMYSVLHMLDV